MEAFRLSRKKYSNHLSGKGASLKGARWNSIGTELIYTAMNRSLAMAEVAVHLTWATLPDDFVMITLFIPDDTSIKILASKDLPKNWNTFPYFNSAQGIGDKFVQENEFCILKVPSAVTKGDFNLLINPHHKEVKKIKITTIEKFPFDQRLFK